MQIDLQKLLPADLERLMPDVFTREAAPDLPRLPSEATSCNDLVSMIVRDSDVGRDGRPGVYRARYPQMAYVVRAYPVDRPPGAADEEVTREAFEQYELPGIERYMRAQYGGEPLLRVARYYDRTHPSDGGLHFDLYCYVRDGGYDYEERKDEDAD